MSWQAVATGLVVAAAIAYLVYKVLLASRPPRRRAGPDVPLGRLTRSARSRRGKRHPPSCH